MRAWEMDGNVKVKVKMVLSSQKNSKPSNEPTNKNTSSIDMTHFNRESHRTTSRFIGPDRTRHSSTRSCSRRGRSHINAFGILSSAWVIGATGCGAGTGCTFGDALVVCFGADVVGHCLGVFGGIWGDVVAADAGVAQCVLDELDMVHCRVDEGSLGSGAYR